MKPTTYRKISKGLANYREHLRMKTKGVAEQKGITLQNQTNLQVKRGKLNNLLQILQSE